MVYDFFYIRADGCLQEICFCQEVKPFVKELQLGRLAMGSETVICKTVGPYYVILVVQKISDSRIDQRTIPFVKGIFLEEKDAKLIFKNASCLYRVITALLGMEYEDVMQMIKKKRKGYTTVAKWIKETGKDPGKLKNKNPDQEQELFLINKCILSGLIEKKYTYIENQVSIGTICTAICAFPFQLQRDISFAFPYGGTPEGECMINVLKKGNHFDLDQDGLRVGISRLLDAGNAEYSYGIQYAACEMGFVQKSKEYRYLLSTDISNIFQLYRYLRLSFKYRWINTFALRGENIERYRKFICRNREFFHKIQPLFEEEGVAGEVFKYLEMQ